MLLHKENKLADIVSTVACPKNALKIDGAECVCTYPFEYSNRIKLDHVSLGDIKSDIVRHCGGCRFKTREAGRKPEEMVKIPLDESQNVACKALGRSVSIDDNCKSCMFLDKKFLKEWMTANPESEMTFIPCTYPNIKDEQKRAFLGAKLKRAIKSARTKAKSAYTSALSIGGVEEPENEPNF